MLLRQLSSFKGPVLKQIDAGSPLHFLTLTHWVEASKFDLGLHSHVVEELLLMPGEHDARKFSRKNTALWRTDWQLIRAQVIRLGVAYCCLHRQHNAANLKPLVAEIARNGLSEMMALDLCKQGAAMSLVPKVCILATTGVPLIALNRRMRLINKRFDGAWSLVHWQGRGQCDAVHQWAFNANLPILYVGGVDQRISGPAAAPLREAADFYYVFEKKKEKKSERAIAELREAGKVVEVVLWQDDGTADLF